MLEWLILKKKKENKKNKIRASYKPNVGIHFASCESDIAINIS